MAVQAETIEADFVVVGAGSAGCVMAARLSEDPATRVVLLEAGGDDTNRWIHIPLGFGKTFADPSVNWCYETEPDPGANNRRIYWPRGKVLGGSSSINGMVYIRGQHEDFDHWRQLGNTGWSSTDVLPYFKRAEHQTRGDDEFHGTGGPLAVSDVANTIRSARRSSRAPADSAFRATTTSTAPTQEGVGYHQTTTRNGKRCSTAVGYLHPAMQRPNLQVVTGALTRTDYCSTASARPGVAFRAGRRARHRARAARGDPVRRRDRLAADSAAVGHRPGRRIWPRSASPWCSICPASGEALQDHYSAPIKLKCSFPITVNDVMLSNSRKLRPGWNTTCSATGR